MAKQKSSKIYIQVGNRLFNFMWAIVGSDRSVMMGFQFEGRQQVELVIDQIAGELRPADIEAPFHTSKGKISFHPSGHYKLDVQMGLNPCAIDRSTVLGPPLENIDTPRRMADLFFPEILPLIAVNPTELDLVLDASTAPRTPLLCTISCVSNENFPQFFHQRVRVVNTSNWEFSRALTSETHTWVWTLRTSDQHANFPNRFILFLYGKVRWGRSCIWKYFSPNWWGRAASTFICTIVFWILSLIKSKNN